MKANIKPPKAAPPATSNPFLLEFWIDSFTIKAIIKPGLKAKLACTTMN